MAAPLASGKSGDTCVRTESEIGAIVARIQNAAVARRTLADLLRPGIRAYVSTLGVSLLVAEQLDAVSETATVRTITTFRGGDVQVHVRTRAVEHLRAALSFAARALPSESPGVLVSPELLNQHLQNAAMHRQPLWDAVADGGAAFRELSQHFDRLMRHFSRKGAVVGSLQEDEMYGDCLKALHDACIAYTGERGRGFRSFVKVAFSNAVNSALRKSNGGTEHQARVRTNFHEAEQILAHEQGRTPLAEDVYARLDWSRSKIENFEDARVLHAARPHSDHEDERLVEFDGEDASVPACDSEGFAELALAKQALDRLDPFSQQVLRLRFITGQSRAATAVQLRTSVDAVKELEDRALDQLTASVVWLRNDNPSK